MRVIVVVDNRGIGGIPITVCENRSVFEQWLESADVSRDEIIVTKRKLREAE